MPPVGIRIVIIGVAAVALVDDDPWAGRVLHLVVTADPELFHILIGVGSIRSSGVSLPEHVVDQD